MTSAPDLVHIRWKIQRAKKKLDELRSEVAPYLEGSPYRIITRASTDAGAPPGAQRFLIKIDREPPKADWSGLIGEIAHNARSALDNLVVQLIVASGNTAPGEGSRTQYPIFTFHKAYSQKSGRSSKRDQMLNGVNSRFRKMIDDTQPYHRTGRVGNDPLAILQTINNRDKHRNAHACFVLMRDFSIGYVYPDGRHHGLRIQVNPDDREPLHDGDSLPWGIQLAPLGDGSQIEARDFTLDIAFETDSSVIALDDLERVVLKVAEIVDRADQLIKTQRTKSRS